MKEIFCVGCNVVVQARLTNGMEIYPRRRDLATLPFWKCDGCGNYVGCHHKTSDQTRPLGNIPTPELRNARKEIHLILDRLWMSGAYTRKQVYADLSRRIGREYHTGETSSLAEVEAVLLALGELRLAHPHLCLSGKGLPSSTSAHAQVSTSKRGDSDD